MKIKLRCGNCGDQMKRQETRGPFPWKDYRSVYLLKSLELFVCDSCGEIGMGAAEVKLVDNAVETTLKACTARFIEIILEREKCQQQELAVRLGVTENHLSALKHGGKVCGFQTFNFLKTLALDKHAYVTADPNFDVRTLKVG